MVTIIRVGLNSEYSPNIQIPNSENRIVAPQ